MESAGFAHQNDKLFAARGSGIDKVALQQHVVLHHDGYDHGGIFRPLGFVNGYGVGRGQLVQLIKFIGDHAFVKGDAQGAVGKVKKADPPHVAVEHVLIVVVAYLHDLVVQAKGAFAAPHFKAVGVQGLLQARIHMSRAHSSLVHGGKHLDVVHRVKPEAARNMVAHQVDHKVGGFFRIILVDEVKVRKAVFAGFQRRNLAAIDKVGVADNFTFCRLAEYFGQLYHRNHTGGYYVGQHVARTHRGQLMHIAHQYKGRAQGNGLEQVVKKQGVHHRGFVHHQQAAGQRTVFVAGEAVLLGAVFQQAVNGAGFTPRGFGHTLGGASCGRSQQDAGAHLGKKPDNGIDDGGLACAGAARKHHNLAAGRGTHGLKLFRRKGYVEFTHHLVHQGVGVFKTNGFGRTHEPLQVERGFGLAVKIAAQVHACFRLCAVRAGHVHIFAHDALVRLKSGQSVGNKVLVNAQLRAYGLHKRGLRQVHVAVIRGFLQHVECACLYAQGVVVLEAQLAGRGIGGDKAYAVDIHGKAIGVFTHDAQGVRPVGAVDAYSIGRGDAVRLQKKQQVAYAAVFAPRCADALQAFLPHAAHLEQALRLFVQYPYGVCAERLDDARGHLFAHALDKP